MIPNEEKNIDISIIVPMWNASMTIERCVVSVVNQFSKNQKVFRHLHNVEIFIINDGSNDNSGNIVKSLITKYNNEQVEIKLFNQANKGPSAARNIGIKSAKGRWILFIDADDELSNDCFSTFNNVINDYFTEYHKFPDVVVPRAICVEDNNKIIHKTTDKVNFLLDKLGISKFVAEVIQDEDWTCRYPLFYSCGKIIYAGLLKDNDVLFDESIRHAEDAIFGSEMLPYINSICVVDKPLYYYHLLNDSLSKGNRDAIESCKAGLRFQKNIFATLKLWKVYGDVPEINNHSIKLVEIFLIDSIRQIDLYTKETRQLLQMLFKDNDFQLITKRSCPKKFYDKVIKTIIRLKSVTLCLMFIKMCRKFKLLQG